MKKLIFYRLMAELQRRPALKRKIKVFAWVAAFGFLVVGVGTIYAAVAGFRYVASVAKEARIDESVHALKAKIEAVPALAPSTCWETANEYLDLGTLAQTPMNQIFGELKQACLGPGAPNNEPQKESELI